MWSSPSQQDAAELESVYRGAPVGLAFIDANLRYVRVNARMAAMNGATPDEHVGRTPSEIMPDLGPSIERLLREVLTTARPIRQLEFSAEAPGEPGEVRDWVVNYDPVIDAAGNVIGVSGAVAEVTAMVRAQTAARRAIAREAQVLAQVNDGVIVTDLEGVIKSWNPGAQRVLGYQAHQIIGRPIWSLFFKEDVPTIDRDVVQRVQETGGLSIEHRNRRADGSECWTRMSVSLLRDVDGVPYGTIYYSTEITDRVLVEKQRDALLESEAAARAQAERENRSKSELLAMMSHELRTPLNAIGGHVQLLEMGLRGPITEDQRETLTRVSRAHRHLLRLVNDVLNLSRLQANGLEYRVEPVSVIEVVNEIDPLIAPQVRERGLSLVVNASTDSRVLADREKLVLVLLNLVSNAVKFTPPGGTISIECVTRADGSAPDRAFIRVRDTGVGIPRSTIDSVFAPFVQLSTDIPNRTEGTGLGLTISQDLVRGMGGQLRVRSELGVGSTFTIALPRPSAP